MLHSIGVVRAASGLASLKGGLTHCRSLPPVQPLPGLSLVWPLHIEHCMHALGKVICATGSCDKIVCVGKNYLLHAKELGDAVPDKPVIFMKPPSVGVQISADSTGSISLPEGRGSCHYETEIVLQIGEQGKPQAVSLGLELTLRDLQRHLKDNSLPWEIAKVFPQSAVIGPWVDLDQFPDYLDTEFSFSLDSDVKQRGHGRDMQWQPDYLVKYIQECFPLLPGDLLFTGTPHGVGPLRSGQVGHVKWGDKLAYTVQF